jgi:predicted DNA-binding transcriptional regulator YafY
MQASRLISVLMRLQARGRATAEELAQELEVSVRTIYRDVDQLSFAGIPIVAERGRLGGFKLLDGFRTELTGMTPAEAETLFLAGLPGPAAELGLTQLMAVARTKLLAALPAGQRVERIASRFHLDATGWFRNAEPVTLLPAIAQAIWAERFLNIRYASDKSSVIRRLGPLGLVLKAGIWYLVAQKGNAFRTYRVGRISAAEPQEERFARPKSFDLAAYWAQSSRDYELGTYRDHATIRLSPRGLKILDLLGPYVVQEAEKSIGNADGQGWVQCTIPLESAEFGIRELMRLGEEVEIVSPPALRTQMVRTLRKTLACYA